MPNYVPIFLLTLMQRADKIDYMKKNNHLTIKLIKAFTLAEVLITLAIIGVVASMTVPGLITNINETQYHTAWKKNYADISQAAARIKQDNGGTFKGLCADSDNDCLKNNFAKYMSYTKECDKAKTDGTNPCIYNTETELFHYSGNVYTGSWWASTLVLNNGSILWFSAANYACDRVFNSSNVVNCGWFMIDVNGLKKPNTIGKDVYHGWFTEDRVLPVGALDQDNSASVYRASSCSSTGGGWGCSAKFLLE